MNKNKQNTVLMYLEIMLLFILGCLIGVIIISAGKHSKAKTPPPAEAAIITQPVFLKVESEKIQEESVDIQPMTVSISTGKKITIKPEEIKNNKPPDDETVDTYDPYISEICKLYPFVGQALVKSIIYHESRFNPNEKTGNCLGLMQVSTDWHMDRAAKLGVTNFYDPYGNILMGVDYLNELFEKYEDTELVLMLYNMKHETAFKLHREGKVSKYASSVIAKAEEYKKGEL